MTGDLILSAMCAAALLLPATVIASRTASAPEHQDDEHDPRRCGDCKALGLPERAEVQQRIPRQTRTGGDQW